MYLFFRYLFEMNLITNNFYLFIPLLHCEETRLLERDNLHIRKQQITWQSLTVRMEILFDPYSPPVLVSNARVLEVLEKQVEQNEKELHNNQNQDNTKKKKKKQKVYYRRRDWIQEEALMYLKSSPCSTLDFKRMDELKTVCMSSKESRKQQQQQQQLMNTTNSAVVVKQEQDDSDDSNDNMKRKTGYSLTEAEAIQVMNMMPKGVVDVHLLVTEAHTRIGDEDDIQAFLERIEEYRLKNRNQIENDNGHT
jgi:RNA polymerase Rpb4